MIIDTEKMHFFQQALIPLDKVCKEACQKCSDPQLLVLMKMFVLQVEKLEAYVANSIQAYAHLESRQIQKANTIFDEKQWIKEGLTYRHRIHHSIRKDKSIISYLTNGICVGAFAKVEAAKYKYQYCDDLFSANVNASIGNARGKVDAKVLLFEGKQFKPSLHLLAEAKASLAKGGIGASLGNSYVHADGNVDVEVGCVKASAKAVVNEDGIDLKAEVGAAAVSTQIKGSFTFLGVRVSATGIYEFASVGASAEFSKTTGKFSFGAKGSLIAGLGFKIDIDY